VDVLSVRTGLATDRVLGRAHAAGKEAHAWTVDDPKVMGELIDQGVDGLITNDPVAALAVRRERQKLPAWERVVLGFRRQLGGR
jgi:glycerophosphoryl diester phosphodiesterase